MIGDVIPTQVCPACLICVELGPMHICPADAVNRAARRAAAIKTARRGWRIKHALRTMGRSAYSDR